MHVQCCSVFVQCMSVRYRAFLGMSVVFKTSSVMNEGKMMIIYTYIKISVEKLIGHQINDNKIFIAQLS